MPIKAMIRTPRDTPTATPILIPSLDSGDASAVRLLERGSAIERVLVKEGSVDVEEVSEDDCPAVGDTVSVTVSVILSVVPSVVLSVILSVSLADSVAGNVMVLCELTLIALDR